MLGFSFRRAVGGLIGLAYFAVNGAGGYASETAFWAERRQAAETKKSPPVGWLASVPIIPSVATPVDFGRPSLPALSSGGVPSEVAKTLPAAFFQENASLLATLSTAEGSIRRIRLPPHGCPSKIILHVQDVHLNADAQSRISALVTAVNRDKAVDLIGLEGAFGPLEFTRYQTFPHQETVREVARVLLEKGDISGPVHAALVGPPTPSVFVGVDDYPHYRANVDAYRASAPLQASTRLHLEGKDRRLEEQKIIVFSPPLLAFDKKIREYRAGGFSLGDHLQSLKDGASPLPPSIVRFLAVWVQEKSLNFQQAERERRELVEGLAAKVDALSLSSLAAEAAACRAGSRTYAAFYRQLGVLCQKAGLSLNSYPALDDYIRYVLAADQISPDHLFRDMRAAEDQAYARLVRTEIERKLLSESRRLGLMKKLVEFSLIPEEWEEYEKGISELGSPLATELSSFEKFYKEAQVRDESMTRKFLEAMENRKASTALLVTGGFHSAGMENRFLQAGAAVVTFTPRIDKIDTAAGSSYLNVFAREKTPLERMFQGRALFLTPDIYSPTVQNGTGPLLAAALEAARGARDLDEQRANTTFQALSSDPGAPQAQITALRLPGDQVGVTVQMGSETTTLWVHLSPGNDRVLAYDVTRPGEGRTREKAERFFKKLTGREAGPAGVHFWAAITEWNVLSKTFVVEHHPRTAKDWIEQIDNRGSFLWGAALLFVATLLLAVAMTSVGAPDVVLKEWVGALLISFPLAGAGKIVWHMALDTYRWRTGGARAAKGGNPSVGTQLINAVETLDALGRAPAVNGRPLIEFKGQPEELILHLGKYCLVQSPKAVLRILERMVEFEQSLEGTPHSVRRRDLYEGLFEQHNYLERHFSEKKPFTVVNIRGGRAAGNFAEYVHLQPLVRMTAALSGGDSGRSLFVTGYFFGMPGIADVGKALLNLAGYKPLKNFLGKRFKDESGADLETSEKEFLKDFEGLTEHLTNGKTARSSAQVKGWINDVGELDGHARDRLGLFFSTFLRILKTHHAAYLIGSEHRNDQIPPFRFNNFPFRSIAILGAVWHYQAAGFNDPWQKAITDLSSLLKLRSGDSVHLATASPQHIMGLTEDGKVFLVDTGMNEFPLEREIVWSGLVDKIEASDDLLKQFHRETGLTLRRFTREELASKGVHPSVVDEVAITSLRLNEDEITPANIKKTAEFFTSMSRSAKGADNPVVVHDATKRALTTAQAIVYGPGSITTSVEGATLARGNLEGIDANRNGVKIMVANPRKEMERFDSDAKSMVKHFFRYLSGRGSQFGVEPDWEKGGGRLDLVLGMDPSKYPGLDLEADYIPFSSKLVRQATGNTVPGIALDLESATPSVREGTDYSESQEYGFDPSLILESIISAYAIRSAGYAIEENGTIKRKPIVPEQVAPPPFYPDHMNKIQARMKELGLPDSTTRELVGEMNDFKIKNQRWFYARLMRRLGFGVWEWLPECREATWTELTSRMNDLLNSVTECMAFDKDDTLDPRNTNLSPEMARRLAGRIAAGQKIAIVTAKSLEEIAKVKNELTGKLGIEIFAPLREALVEELRSETEPLGNRATEDRADDLLRDLFFLFMDSGGTLARLKKQGSKQTADLAIDEIYSVVYPSDLLKKIQMLLGFHQIVSKKRSAAAGEDKSPLEDMLVKSFSNWIGSGEFLAKIIFAPFGPDPSERTAREKVAKEIATMFKTYNIPVSPHASGKTSIDFHLLVNGQYIEKRRALEYLFNQGHRQIIFIDNEIFDGGNGASAVDLLRDMNKYPTKYPGKSLRVVSVDPVDMPEKMRGTLGEEEKQIRSFVAAPTPDALRSHGELHSPQLELLSLAGLSETDATAAYLDNTPFGAAAAKKFSPGNEIKVSLSIELHPNEIVGKLIRLNEKGQQEMTLTTHSSHWDPAVSLAPEVFQMVSVLREQAQHTRAQIDSQISVVAGPHFPRKIHANLPLKLEGTAAKGVDFIFPSWDSKPKPPNAKPYSVREQSAKAAVHGVLAAGGAALAASHLLLGLGTVLAIPVAILTAATYFRYAWKATLARNEQRRLMAEVGQWDPHTDHIRTAKSLAAIQSQFQRFGFTSDPQSGSFGLTINGKQANVRLPKDPTELAGLLGRDRLAETRRTKNGFEIVIAPNIDPALLPSVVLTEIHRVSPLGAVRAFFNQLIAFALAHTPNRLWEARLARQDMRSFGVPLPAESRRPLMDLLMPPFESLDINGLDGHAVRMAHVSRRLNAGGAYAQEWAGKVDTLVSFHQVLTEDLPALREFIESRPAGGSDQFQILLVPGVNDPSLERAMADLAGKNVTVLKHVFQPSGEVKIDGAHFHSWSQGKGAIAWLTTRNSRAAPLFPDSTIPLLARLLQLLESAPPLTHANLKAAAAFARTLLTAA